MTAKDYLRKSLKETNGTDLEFDYPKLFEAIAEAMEEYKAAAIKEAFEAYVEYYYKNRKPTATVDVLKKDLKEKFAEFLTDYNK